MEKVIKIGDKEVKLNNNVAWTMEYRDQFGRDVVQDHVPMLASLTEALASIASEAGDDGKIELTSILSSLEGRTIDVLLPLMQTEIMGIIVNVTWAMAKAADENIAPPKQWVRQFDEFPLDVVVPVVYDLAMSGFVSSKNLKRLKKIKKELTNLQPLHSTQSSSQVSKED